MDRRTVTSPLPPESSEATLFERHPNVSGEVKFIDIGAAVVRRKFIIGAFVLVFAAVGLFHAFYKEPVFEYTTIIEIGNRYVVSKNDLNGRFELIEPIDTVRAKVANGYIAQVLLEHVKKTNDKGKYDIKADVPKNSQILILGSRGIADNEAVYEALHEAIADRIRQDHLRVQGALRKDLEERLDLQLRSLMELRQHAKRFDAKLEQLERKAELPTREMSYLTALRLADNQRAQAEIINLIDNVRLQLVNMRETKTVVSPMRSLEPIGLRKEMSVLFAGLFGLLLGVVVALLVDFGAKARDQDARTTSAT